MVIGQPFQPVRIIDEEDVNWHIRIPETKMHILNWGPKAEFALVDFTDPQHGPRVDRLNPDNPRHHQVIALAIVLATAEGIL